MEKFSQLWLRANAENYKTDEVFEGTPHCEKTKSNTTYDVHQKVKRALFSSYDFRYNVLTEQVEYRKREEGNDESPFLLVNRRILNTMVIEMQQQGIGCWDKDVERLLRSNFVESHHPFYAYMEALPKWDGIDRIIPLAQRIDDHEIWVNGFRRWLLALTAQWMGKTERCANTLTPILVSDRQGMSKSTFCRLLMPPELRHYYLDKFDLNAKANIEAKLGLFGLINLDEFDRYSATALATLKNLVQLKELTVRKAYANFFIQLARIASFIGTSNEKELLKDPTGSRRFLCVEVKHKIDCSEINHSQIFAQLKQLVNEGERVWMDSKEETMLQIHNKLFQRLSPDEEVFLNIFRSSSSEKGVLMTTTEIHRQLCKHNPSAMRGISVYHLGRTLSNMGLHRTHTRTGNRYRVERIEAE